MDIIAFTLEQFKEEVPTYSHLIEVAWRPYFHKLDDADKPAFKAMIDYADAYHYLKAENLRALNIRECYAKLINKFGNVNPDLPSELDINVLRTMHTKLKAKEDAKLAVLVVERQGIVDKEMAHIRDTLKSLDTRLSDLGLSYSIIQEHWIDHISIRDEQTDRNHTGELY